MNQIFDRKTIYVSNRHSAEWVQVHLKFHLETWTKNCSLKNLSIHHKWRKCALYKWLLTLLLRFGIVDACLGMTSVIWNSDDRPITVEWNKKLAENQVWWYVYIQSTYKIDGSQTGYCNRCLFSLILVFYFCFCLHYFAMQSKFALDGVQLSSCSIS